MNKAKIVRDKSFFKMLFMIAVPVTMQNLIVFVTQMMDTVMLGELGDVAMSASALANQPFFIFNMLVFGLAGGASVLTAQYWGKKDMRPIKIIITTAIRIALIAGIILGIVVYLFPEQIMGLFTKDISVITAGSEYLKIICFSYFFFGFTCTFFSVIRSVEIVKIAVISNIIALVTNIISLYLGTLDFQN